MDTDRIQRIQDLFESALTRAAEERTAFVREASGDDVELRTEVESLLEHDQSANDNFMRVAETRSQPPSAKAPDTVRMTPPAEGRTVSVTRPDIGGYEITQELGRGGQGVVYQAIQKATKRKVAIKILIQGPYASASAQKRFEREIELVAQLRHPNIISIFHSGTTSGGHPFYVMDYVRGLPLQEYVRSKNLALEETLELFLTVCEAVQHAHQRGVIHRDLKPTNIVVDENGTPRILDFGLAKPLSAPAPSLISISQEIIGTLPYMSPEQASGNSDAIDTRTDVYSLGVILYELLTGRRPYPVEGPIADVLRHISETQPTPPRRSWTPDTGITRRATRRLRSGECPIDNEIETITFKALAKEPERRYQSAGELARDIRHYLLGEPIEARGDSLAYVLWKQSRRYFRQAPVAALALLCAILAPGLLVSLIFWHHAAHERDIASAAISFLNNDVFQTLDPEKVGRDVDLRELLDAASERIEERFAQAPLAEASIRHTLGNFYCSLGQNREAVAHLERALQLRRAKLGERHLAVAESLVSLSRVLENMGRDVEAESHLREALAMRAGLLGQRHPLVTTTLSQLAAFARRQGNLELEALLAVRTVGLSPAVAPASPVADGHLSPRVDASTRSAEEPESLRRRLAQTRQTHGDSHPETALRLTELADRLVADESFAEAEPLYEEALAIWTDQLGSEHVRAHEVFVRLEDLFVRSGETEKAVSLLNSQLDRALAGGDNPRFMSSASWNVVKRPDRSADLYTRALEAARRACALQPENGAFWNTLGVAQYRAGLFEDAYATLTRADKLNDGHPADIAFLAMSLARVGQADAAQREFEWLRALMQRQPWATDPQSLRFLREAQVLIEGSSEG
ncbi:MAG: protein kinase [Planctomycetes bacterium]|nr:protein kinase [Planctomycetota bacterium]